ncbi:hypothetical protein [Natronorubrum thiooxidans]|uniref:Uncharacterized protein n=1 Tax=Natronorubrum thiooxidans TaxID=308853 RepID=A0A1N7FW51_9EURY|nr:hypothetical protein [Natronorubrum thiooxidans]SIS04561.1 hypothetical protein SAMN05421752_108166 [Natronorubrum thiooxidans]
MSTQHLQTRTEPEPQPTNRTRTTPADTTAVTEDPRTATDMAPRTFSHRNTARLENLMDEWNTAFANAGSESTRSA